MPSIRIRCLVSPSITLSAIADLQSDRNHLFDSTLAAAIYYAAAAFATGLVFFAAALRTAAHLFLVAAMMALRPAALSFRLGFAGAALAFLMAAHLLRCAAPIRLRAAALSVCFAGAASSASAFGRPGPRWPSWA